MKIAEPEAKGMSFKQYYTRCRENFLVSTEVAMKTQLVEFSDHGLITKQKKDAQHFLRIPIPKRLLQDIVATLPV
jgi:origin recognition complex subunit 2